MTVLRGNNNFFYSPKLDTRVALRGERSEIQSQIGGIMDDGVLSNSKAIRGIDANTLAVDVLYQIMDG